MKTTERDQHRTRTRRQDDGKYSVWCSCGWVGPAQDTEEEAEDQATDHIVAVAR